MNTPEHYAIVKLAFACLKQKDVRSLRDLESEVLGTCMLPDQIAIPLLQGKQAPWRRYFPAVLPKFNFAHNQADFRALMPKNRFYVRKIMQAVRQGEMAEAARFLGVYSHCIGDFSQPAHLYELEIGNLLPPPLSLRNCNYHRMLEDIPNSVKRMNYRPRLLGTTPQEFLFRLEGRYTELHRLSVAAVIPMVSAIYHRDHPGATAVLNEVLLSSARLFADVCLTAWVLATRRLSPGAGRHLAHCDLREIEPHALDVEFNFSHKVLVDRITIEKYGPSQPLALYCRRGNRRVAVPVKGVCALPHALPMAGIQLRSMLEYHLPAGAFRRFNADVGLLATRHPQARACFEVQRDDHTVWKSPLMKPGDCARRVSANVSSCRRLRLLVHTDGSTDKMCYAVWGNPQLAK